MSQKIKNQNISYNAFTLIEMMIVLIIMGILLLFTISLSGDQIQKIKNKSVKESILAEMQTRYSRNLGSSSFAGKMYSTMDVKLVNGENKIDFLYNVKDGDNIENSFTNRFKIRYITTDYYFDGTPSTSLSEIELKYSPYQISCEIGDGDEIDNLIIVARVNDNRDYCFEIKQKNCRLIEVSEEKCNLLRSSLKLDDN